MARTFIVRQYNFTGRRLGPPYNAKPQERQSIRRCVQIEHERQRRIHEFLHASSPVSQNTLTNSANGAKFGGATGLVRQPALWNHRERRFLLSWHRFRHEHRWHEFHQPAQFHRHQRRGPLRTRFGSGGQYAFMGRRVGAAPMEPEPCSASTPMAPLFTNLYNFSSGWAHGVTNSDGQGPRGALVLSGNTLCMGRRRRVAPESSGTVFALNTDGTGFTNLHNFPGPCPRDNFPPISLYQWRQQRDLPGAV